MSALHPARVDALHVLAGWTPPDAQQSQLRDEYIAFMREHDDAAERRSRVGHITASALLLSPDGDQVLLTLHARIGRWLQLGGHIEPGDATVVEAALREAREESGMHDIWIDPVPVRLDRHEVPCSDKRGGVDRLHHWDVQFLARARNTLHSISEESADLAWWPLQSLPEVDASVAALVAEAARR